MKKALACAALACGALCLAGCFTLDKATIKSSGKEHVVVRNYGWKLFDVIPLFCGNATEGAWWSFVMFRDDVTMEKLQGRLMKEANGREVETPVYDPNGSPFFDIWGIPIPYILTYQELSLSGTFK